MKLLLSLALSLFFCTSLSSAVSAKYPDKEPAQNFTGTTLEGKSISLEELRGKVVVLIFWSTRCPICSSELPKVNQLVTKYANQNVVFLGLSMENETLISAYTKKKPFSATLIPNSLGVIMQYAVKNKDGSFNIAYPSFFVINQKGEIEMQVSGRKSGAVDSQVSRLLSGN